jgi:hypothetical protein
MNHKTLSLQILLLILIGALPFAAIAQNFGEASHGEYAVYEAVFDLMDHIPKEDPHVTVFSVTLNSKCGEDASPIPLANGCTFLWVKPDTPDNVKELLRSEGAHVDNSTWSDFVKKNANSVRLHEPISTPWKHKLIAPGDEPSKDWESPDLTLFVSRVGFNEKRTQALVYVLLFSYMDRVSTAGDYFFFRLDKSGHWQVDGRMTYFKLEKAQTAQ